MPGKFNVSAVDTPGANSQTRPAERISAVFFDFQRVQIEAFSLDRTSAIPIPQKDGTFVGHRNPPFFSLEMGKASNLGLDHFDCYHISSRGKGIPSANFKRVQRVNCYTSGAWPLQIPKSWPLKVEKLPLKAFIPSLFVGFQRRLICCPCPIPMNRMSVWMYSSVQLLWGFLPHKLLVGWCWIRAPSNLEAFEWSLHRYVDIRTSI